MSKAKEVRELKTIIEQQELVIDWLIGQLEKLRPKESCAEKRKE